MLVYCNHNWQSRGTQNSNYDSSVTTATYSSLSGLSEEHLVSHLSNIYLKKKSNILGIMAKMCSILVLVKMYRKHREIFLKENSNIKDKIF